MTSSNAAWWDTPAVTTFRDVATRFRTVVEGRDSYSASAFLHAVHPMLAELYVAGFALPTKPGSEYPESDEENPVISDPDPIALEKHSQRWSAVCLGIANQIGPRWVHYQEVFDPYADPAEAPVVGSLADDLADLFLDLEEGEQLWAVGDYDEAVWQWRFGFETHWGEHATGALRAVRTLAAMHDLGFPNSRD